MTSIKLYFTKTLLYWNKHENDRKMPWKFERDPYKIWLSEIILQQTRVDQGWDYYNRFIHAYPNIGKLATAREEKIFKMWEGLGYYSRCKNLIATAKLIHYEKKGKFPRSYKELLTLKGVGPYTAAAIASFAYNLPCAVLDGNVFRVLSRFFGIETAIDSTAGRNLFAALASELLDKKEPGMNNQALMDFGAVICKPKNPQCKTCPLNKKCIAYTQGITGILPVKENKLSKKQRWFYYYIIEQNSKLFVRKRIAKDIWENLYEFLLLESDRVIPVRKLTSGPVFKKIAGINKYEKINVSRLYKQQLSHQTIQGRFIHVQATHPLSLLSVKAISFIKLKKLPFPKFINQYLAENETLFLKDKMYL